MAITPTMVKVDYKGTVRNESHSINRPSFFVAKTYQGIQSE